METGRASGSLRLQTVLSDLHQLPESLAVGGGNVGEHFTIEIDFGCLQAFHEAAVSQPRCTGSCVDSDLPQAAESPLLVAAVTVGILPAMIKGIGCIPIKFGSAQAEAFGGLDSALAALARCNGVGDSHGTILLIGSVKALGTHDSVAERQVGDHAFVVTLVQFDRLAELAATLRAFARKQVSLAGMVLMTLPDPVILNRLATAFLVFAPLARRIMFNTPNSKERQI